MVGLKLVAAAAAGVFFAGTVAARAVVGEPAPAFSAVDTRGKSVSLSDHRGKYVVLEWMNPGCPFTQKHYDSGNMPAVQKDATGRGVVWLSVSTTARDASDYMPPADLTAWVKTKTGVPNSILMDDGGTVARAYGARTTPHMFVIDPNGKLIYAGAIDSKRSLNRADIKTATNYVRHALDEALAGKPISNPVTQPYGCSVKYPQ